MILLFTGEQGEQYGYQDHFHIDGTFWYTGEGQKGDMQLTKGNLAILKHAERNKKLHLFAYVSKSQVQYWGGANYLDHHEEERPDIEGKPRRAYVFELALDSGETGQPAKVAKPDHTPPEKIWKPLWKQPLQKLRDAVFAAAAAEEMLRSTPAERKQIVYVRSARLKAYVIRRANGVCEGCCSPAPFLTRKNTPYLEPHHIRRVADGGPDHPRWVIALCPNCHARVHHGMDGFEYNEHLALRMAEIEG